MLETNTPPHDFTLKWNHVAIQACNSMDDVFAVHCAQGLEHLEDTADN